LDVEEKQVHVRLIAEQSHPLGHRASLADDAYFGAVQVKFLAQGGTGIGLVVY
jgi:hypothetical protein